MKLATTLLVWSTNDSEALKKLKGIGIDNVSISVDAGEINEDVFADLAGLGVSVLAKQSSTKESVEELCAILDTTDVVIDCSSTFVYPDMDYNDIILGLDPTAYNINLLLTPAILDDLKVACDNGFEDVHPIFIYHGTVDKILKNLSKEIRSEKRQSIAITFVEHMDRPVFYANIPMFFAFTNEIIFWSIASLDKMILIAPPEAEQVVKEHTLIECVKTTSVRIAPSFASRIDLTLTVKEGDRFEELETRRPAGSTALFSRINCNGTDRWVVRSNNQDEYFVEVQ